jgi:hypothetical protein
MCSDIIKSGASPRAKVQTAPLATLISSHLLMSKMELCVALICPVGGWAESEDAVLLPSSLSRVMKVGLAFNPAKY